jgi:hypothetical protein
MVEITTQPQARIASQLEFCYVCGKPFTENNPATRDHVPPRKIFLEEDRNWPLILPAHRNCNSEYSFSDEQAKGLLALLRPSDKPVAPHRTEQVGIVERDSKPAGVLIKGLSLRRIVAKVLRACHAALYHEYLRNEDTNRAVLLPLPIFDPETGDVDKNELLPQHEMLCNVIKDNRSISNVDKIQAYNGKFRYEAVWGSLDNDKETYFGIFAIDICEWHNLANNVLGSPQGCFGMYRLNKSPIPQNACVATSIELPHRYLEPLNPFEN